MNDTLHRTDTLGSCKTVICGKQKMHWIEFQMLDEQGEPLANLPYRACNEATRSDFIPEYSGRTDAEGVIRLDGLHPLAITLLIDAELLAEILQNRRLRAQRAEPARPGFADRTPLYGPQRSGFSPIEQQAVAAGHGYHYLRIGQLCDRLPTFDPPLADARQPPAYHFPDPKFGGFTIGDDQLDRRHVLEVCPLRAWSLTLHHHSEYSLVNAYNLSLMSIMAYSRAEPGSRGSAEEFFLQQCLDLSRTPRVWDDRQNLLCVVTDVPFDQRYSQALMLDTKKAEPPVGDTQLFYAVNATQVLVAWRGTEMDRRADLITDATFRPVKPEVQGLCEPKVPCADLTPEGSVHLGFRESFELASRIYAKDLGKTIPDRVRDRNLFICGHSLGGALGLVHAASLKAQNPLLYTYGMPRTFTLKAVKCLDEIVHFRHVNDIDPVPSVPPEAALDNYLYDLYGPLGTTLGFTWSMLQLTASQLFRHGDPFCHHGEIAMFFRAEQHTRQRGSSYPAYRNKDGLGAPYHTTIAYRLSEKVKFYLVPSLSPDNDQQAEQAQQRLTTSLTAESRTRFFPPFSNPKAGRIVGLGNHLMGNYQPYIYGQLLESINPERSPLLKRQLDRQSFEQQIRDNYADLVEDELARNQVFLELQSRLGESLRVTQQADGGAEALQRFDAVADSSACYERAHC
ncbi:lipase family protein [Pseudomonas sp. GL-B-12]|uniref:lipase family protein n=1 Tax=Pseudomonas sp. GL-B-12 TaxID=2832374 RepID=UPI001CBF2184|nr:lipase family protein [Pseudomonas sp. GL-B-12]